jgi:hypothetical protein
MHDAVELPCVFFFWSAFFVAPNEAVNALLSPERGDAKPLHSFTKKKKKITHDNRRTQKKEELCTQANTPI